MLNRIKLAIALVFGTFLCFSLQAQSINWQNKDLKQDTVFGISVEKAYLELLPHKKAHPVIVGVIDSGVDTAHEDLKTVIWVNSKEKPGNGIDDDHDGHVDDIHGWDFIGGTKGDVAHDNLELVRLLREQSPFYDSLVAAGPVPENFKARYEIYKKMKDEYDAQLKRVQQTVAGIKRFKSIMDSMAQKIGKDSPALADWKGYNPTGSGEQRVQSVVVHSLENGMSYNNLVTDGIEGPLKHYEDELEFHLNRSYDPRSIVGDDYSNSSERNYGNADVQGPDALHGTHVAGIIGAIRHNGLGIDGIADHVQIMAIRVVPDGDERDKDVANGIRYAADHGAKVINMSFGKGYSKDKAAVDAAAKYAMSKDVLLVQAAGNDGKDLDDTLNANFPNRHYLDGSEAGAWIVVGASGWKDDSTLVAPFSNYGKKSVDVFAPGVQIYSSIPGSKYAYESGTSMAAPVVTGLAALIREYYPKLTAMQVKEIILRSAVKPAHKVTVKGKMVDLGDISVSGGIVNAYEAMKLAH